MNVYRIKATSKESYLDYYRDIMIFTVISNSKEEALSLVINELYNTYNYNIADYYIETNKLDFIYIGNKKECFIYDTQYEDC